MKHMIHRRDNRFTTLLASTVSLAWLCTGPSAMAQPTEQPAPAMIQWQASDTAGEAVAVPVADKPSVVLFVKAAQDRSDQAMTQLTALLAEPTFHEAVQAIAVVSGQDAGVGAAQLTGSDLWPGPVVVDADYKLSGLMSTHVWPTTEIIDREGKRIAHLPGMRESYGKDLRAYLEFALGQIDQAALDARLATNGTVASMPDSVASRHLHMAERLLEKGQTALALEELKNGLAVDPHDAQLILTLARVHVMTQQPTEALALLDGLDEDAAPAWRVQTLRGRALVELDRYEEAGQALNLALEINPDPAEAYYYLGRVLEQAGEWQRASAAYRNAFEKSPSGQSIGAGAESD